MTDEDEAPQWLLEPPGPNEVHFSMAIGDDVELSAEARAALEELMSELGSSDVSGFALGFGIWDCDELNAGCPPDRCMLMNCQPRTIIACAAKLHCKIEM